MTIPAGFDCTKSLKQLANGWSCELTPSTELGRAMLPDQPIRGFGPSEDEAAWDALESFARALGKLTSEQRQALLDESEPLDGRGHLVGALADQERFETSDESAAVQWAATRSEIKQ